MEKEGALQNDRAGETFVLCVFWSSERGLLLVLLLSLSLSLGSVPDRPAVSSRDELRPGQSRPMKETLVGRELRGLLVSLASRFICVTAYGRQGQPPAEGEVMSPDYFNTYSVVVCKAAACCLGLRALI